MEIYFLRNFVCLFVCLFVMAVSAVNFRKANLMSLSKALVKNNCNVSTNFSAATIENENEAVKVSGEKFWKNTVFLMPFSLILTWRK